MVDYKKNKKIFLFFMTFFSLFSSNIFGVEFNLPYGVSSISHKVYDLHMIIFWICVVIGIIVFGILIYSLIKHRRSAGHEAHDFHENVVIEILWTVIPFIILVVIAIPSTNVLKFMHDNDKPDLNVKITGYQWRWEYEYLGDNVKFFSNLATPQSQIHNLEQKNSLYLKEVDRPLVLPISKKIRFLFTSNDVIHTWWVRDLGVKKDAIPGFINESWVRIDKPGTYYGQCAELCGVNHGYMPIVVIAKTEEEFAKWLEEQKEPKKAKAA